MYVKCVSLNKNSGGCTCVGTGVSGVYEERGARGERTKNAKAIHIAEKKDKT